MLTLQKSKDAEIASVAAGDRTIDELLNREWLLTNSRGGYSSSTIVGCNTRRYHGLLIGSPNPLSSRILGLANCLEMVILKGAGPGFVPHNGEGIGVVKLSTFEFNGKFAPEGFGYIRRFRCDTGVHFDYEFDNVRLTKSVYLAQDEDTVALVYDFADFGGGHKTTAEKPQMEFVWRPFAALRDFHSLQKSYARLCCDSTAADVLVRHQAAESFGLWLNCSCGGFTRNPQWWFNFVYRKDAERGQDFTEDLWSPGFYKVPVQSGTRVVFRANLLSCAAVEKFSSHGMGNSESAIAEHDLERLLQDLSQHQEAVRRKAGSVDRKVRHTILYGGQGPKKVSVKKMLAERMHNGYQRNNGTYERLSLAADQFIASRSTGRSSDKTTRTTILAGYPWFADWGRDAFISLPGLLLLTGRFDEAKAVLSTFSAAVDDGMIPNRFDDSSDTAYFNSIDASLWFINAAFKYLEASGDSKTFTEQLLPVIRWIMDCYHNGTKFDIHVDSDGLITGGDAQTQLTWMDAMFEGVAFTPRCGKTVEVNALWYNSLRYLGKFYAGRNIETAQHFESMATQVAQSFVKAFWNEQTGYLNDCIGPDGTVDATLRPNQIFAVSLTFSPLSSYQASSVVEVVRKHLLTPYGLRTLNVEDERYKGRYVGSPKQRDEAYHQGTVWPYLMGPFIEAYLKVNGLSRKSKKKAEEFIQPLLHHLTEDGCLGQASEIFDGDAPHEARGCFAQAWSIAELIRAYYLIHS